MAQGTNIVPVDTAQVVEHELFQQKWLGKFADNNFELIDPEDFREFVTDLVRVFPNWRELTNRRLRGGLYPLNYTDQLSTIPEGLRVLGMQAVARWGVTAADYLAGQQSSVPAYFQLVADPAGSINALRDELATTVATVKASWQPLVFGSGTGGGTPGSSALRSQHTTSNGLRNTGPFLFDAVPPPLSIKLVDNLVSLTAQVNYRDPLNANIWIAGDRRTSSGGTPAALAALLTQVDADIRAIPAEALALSGELRLRVQALENTLESNYYLTGLTSGVFYGKSLAFRDAYTGAPPGNLIPNGDFKQTTTAWQTTGNGSGWSYGDGQAASVGGNPNQEALYQVIGFPVAGRYRFIILVEEVTVGAVYFSVEAPVGFVKLDPVISTPGTYTYEVDLPQSTVQVAFKQVQGAVLKGCYALAIS